MLRRNAVFPYHCPTGTVATSAIATCDSALATFSCAATSGSVSHCADRSRASALHNGSPIGLRQVNVQADLLHGIGGDQAEWMDRREVGRVHQRHFLPCI